MSQHDMQIANNTGIAVRGDINAAFAALVTNNSGDTAPSPTYPFMWWADSNTGHLKQRNAANTAWIDHGLNSESLLRTGAVEQSRLPIGAVIDMACSTPPPYMIAGNGGAFSRTTYAALWAFAQASGLLAASEGAKLRGQWGPGDGSTTFTAPDYRGTFARAVDSGAGLDPDRALGTYQADAIKSHTHTMIARTGVNPPAGGATVLAGEAQAGSYVGEAAGGAENTVKNIAVLRCIQAF